MQAIAGAAGPADRPVDLEHAAKGRDRGVVQQGERPAARMDSGCNHWGVGESFGVPGGSARKQEEERRKRRQELERLERREDNWNQGAAGEESTAAAIARRCPAAVALHDRQMPGSRANIDHIVLVASGVWVIDSKRPKGRIKVQKAKGGAQKLLIGGHDRTELVHKLTRQVNAVKAAMLQAGSDVPVNGAFCFHLQADTTIERLRAEDNGLPVFGTWTIDGYPLFYPRQMCKRLNDPGTLTSSKAHELARTVARTCSHPSGMSSQQRRQLLRPRNDTNPCQLLERKVGSARRNTKQRRKPSSSLHGRRSVPISRRRSECPCPSC